MDKSEIEEKMKKQLEIYESNLMLHQEREAGNKQNDDYEINLKLHLDVMQNELRIILSNSMPNQINNIKTILWVNMLFITISLQLFLKVNINTYALIAFYMLVVGSVLLLLIALLSKRYKYYGTVESDYASKIYNDRYQTMDMISTLLGTTEDAIKKNKSIMRYIAKFMNIATWLTFISLLVAILTFVISIYIKGGNKIMADDKQPPKVPTQQIQPTKPVHEAEERSLGNITAKTPKDSNTSGSR